MLIKIGLEGKCFPTEVTVILDSFMDTLIVSLQTGFAGGFIWTQITAIPDFLMLILFMPSQIIFISEIFFTMHTLKLLLVVTPGMNCQT